MITGALLPSSRPTFLRGARPRIAQPTSGEPVNVIRAMSSWSTRALPTVEPPPVTTCSHSAGRPQSSISSSARAMPLNGVWLAGLSTTGHPAAIAGASLWATRLSGKLNGLIAPTTPIGTRSVKPTLPSPLGDGVEGDHVAGQRARLGGGELERADGPLGLDPGRLDRLGRLPGDDLGELVAALGEQAGRGVEDLGPLPARQRAAGQRRLGRARRPGRRRPAPHTGTRPISAPSYGDVTAVDSVPVNRSPASGTGRTCDGVVMRSTILRAVARTSRPRHPFLDWPGPIAFAHRGGASEAPENTLPAFERAVELGYRYLETDVHVTADGVVVAFHDDDLSRTCGRPGRISELPWREVATARVDGREPIPRLADLLEAWPDARVEHRLQDRPASSSRSADELRRAGVLDRVCVGAFSDRRLRRLRQRLGPTLCTSAGPVELGAAARSSASPLPRSLAAQVPVDGGAASRSSTQRFVARAHRRGIEVHVWTIDDAAEMDRLLDLGVDGIMTDRPAVLRDVLARRGQWVT